MNPKEILADFLTLQEVSEMLNVEQEYILQEIENKKLPARKIGEMYYIQKVKLQLFLRKSNVGIKEYPGRFPNQRIRGRDY